VSAGDIEVDHPGSATRVTATLPWPEITGIYCLSKSYTVNESFLFRESDEIIAAALSQMDSAAVDLARERALGFSLIDRAAEAGKSEVEDMILELGADLAVVRYR
jgi:hypothetical protein